MIGLLVLLHLWPVIAGGSVLAPTSLLYALVPWNGALPNDVFGYYNSLLSDPPLSYYAWDVLVRRLLHEGTLPAWNPHAFGGTPLFGNASVALLSPFSLPLWLLPLHTGLGIAAAAKLWVAGFGTYLLARELRLGFSAAMLAAVGFALCAFNVVWLSHGAHVSVAAWLPVTIWLVERLVRRGRPLDGAALSVVVVFVLTGGHPGTQVHVFGAAVLYAVVRAALHPGISRRVRWERLGMVGAALAIGTLISAIVLLPAVLTATGTVGAAARRDGADALPGATMPLDVLRTLAFPDWWGRPSEQIRAGPANNNERTFYAGAIVLVLAVSALLSTTAWRQKLPFVLLGAVGLAAPVGVPVLRVLIDRLPLFDRIQNQRLLLWSLLALAILGAYGLQALVETSGRQRRVWVPIIAAVFVAVLAAASVPDLEDQLGPALDALRDRGVAGASASSIVLASIGWWLVFVAGLAGILLVVLRRPSLGRTLGVLIVLLVAFDMLHFAHGYQPMTPSEVVVPPRTPAIAFLQREAVDARIVGLDNALPADFSTVYGLRDVRGFDAPQPSRRFLRVWRTLQPQQEPWTPFDLTTIDRRGLAVLGTLGTRYVIAAPETTLPDAPGFASSFIAYRGADATVLVNGLAAPRAHVARRIHVAPDESSELAAITRRDFDPRRDVVLRASELGERPPPAPARTPGRVRVVDERNSSVTLRADLPQAGVVVLSDAWAPGWSVEVDGRPARALQADVIVRGVIVPAGSHEIVWSYRVPGLRLGSTLSVLGLLALGAWAVLGVRGRRPRR